MKAWSKQKIREYTGAELYAVWQDCTSWIERQRDLRQTWHPAYPGDAAELRYTEGRRTLASVFLGFPRRDQVGLLLVMNEQDQQEFEAERYSFSEYIQQTYDRAPVYYDGRWMLVALPQDDMEEMERLIKQVITPRKKTEKNI